MLRAQSLIRGLTTALVVLILADIVLACPTCKESMAHDPAAMSMARGFYWSILFMMSMPFLILVGISAYFYLEIRKARRQQTAAESHA